MLKFIKNSDIIELYDFDVNSERIIVMRKSFATLLAVSMIASLCACNNNTESGADSGGSSVTEEEKKPLSNPVAVDENGNVDMKVALSYETDIDALIKELESREPDGSKPVSKNTNPETLALFNYLKENYGKNKPPGKHGGNREPLIRLHCFCSLPAERNGHGQYKHPPQKSWYKRHNPEEDEQSHTHAGAALPCS